MRFWMVRYSADRVGDGRADLVADVDEHLFCVRSRGTEKKPARSRGTMSSE